MSILKPFKAVRPTPDKVALVSCRNYEDYSAAELASWLNFNPYSFLHILNPAYINTQRISVDKRFKGVSNKYLDFKREGVFIKEEQEVYFIYQIDTKRNSYTGIVAATSLDDYKNNNIKKHEDTLQYRVEMFTDYLKQTQFNTEPVLITYPDKTSIKSFISDVKSQTPLYCFSTTSLEKHTLWKVDDNEQVEWLKKEFETVNELYIADGHHRCESALLLQEQQGVKTELNNYFMSFLIAESDLKIFEFNRLVNDLNGYTPESFLLKLNENFEVESKNQELWKPKSKFEFGMYLDGSFYALKYKKDKQNFDGFLDQLDAQILYNTILNPLLNLGDLRNDERIDYLPGNQSITAIKELVDNGKFAVGFILYPSDVSEIKTLADNGLIMPPKSTYIEPKFRSGLVIYELSE